MRRALSFAVAAALIALPAASHAEAAVQINVLSNRADLISGGDALVEIVTAGDPADLTVDVDGVDVTGSLTMTDGRLVGLLEGLADGDNVVTATLPDATGARITITNHPVGGPIFAGAQVQPWLCTTASNGLGQPQDAQCNAPTTYQYFCRTSSNSGLAACDPSALPSDIVTTTTDQGAEVPYVVRRERGTADRGIYDIAVLYDVAAASHEPAWNNKVYYVFGASCGTIHSQSAPAGVLLDKALSRGFMVVNSSMNNLGNNCNTVVSAEAAMMLKERVVERYGPIRYTIGEGCSGGSIGQQMVGNAYPGIVDGIQPNCSYEDTWSTGVEVIDCHLLIDYFSRVSPHLWPVVQHQLVTGHLTISSCVAWEALFAPVANPNGGCGLTPAEEYPQKPDGCRGSLADYMKSVVGTRPEDGFANLAYDNIGVQYGLNALNSGLIAPEQFVDLNEKIGGLDIDFNRTAARREADPAIATLYRSGQVNDASRLDQVAMVDLRGSSNLEIHTDFHTYSMRARLDKANGHHANHVIWSSHVPLVGDPAWSTEAFLLLDRWLAAVEADTSDAPREVKIARNKPADAVDACWVAQRRVHDMSLCREAIPYFSAPRIAAGGPSTHDIIKCQLKPLEPGDYEASFSADEWARLQAAFPTGVCDWSKPGVDQQPSLPWMTFAGGPGGVPLGAPPASEAF